MIILAIETSCDDTGISIINVKCQNSNVKSCNFEILSNIVSSQVKIHAQYGGVYPLLAKREHQKNLPTVLKKALKKAGNPKIDLIAVTQGPGLEPCLWQGINFAKELTKKLNLPIVPVNHIEAHILANLINNQQLTINNFPAICLVVSGGHTQLILMKDFGKYRILGETRDDAAGECFDKTARVLGLGYPGGPAIEAKAAEYDIRNTPYEIQLPRPMIYHKNYDFSFSGLKTAVLYLVKKNFYKNNQLTINNQQLAIISHEIQQAIIDVLIYKTLKAVKEYKAKSIILGGGVVANNELRKQFKLKIVNCKLKINFLVPPKKFSTDNAAMVAIAGYYQWLKGETKSWKNVEANAHLRLK